MTTLGAAAEAADEPDDEGIPDYLRYQTFRQEKDNSYKYPHDFGGYTEQQYLPNRYRAMKFYEPSGHGGDRGRKEGK